MSPEAHDAAFAAVSHLPHLIAFALMQRHQPAHGKDFLGWPARAFRDFTRIAASDPKMWRDVLLANRDELLEQAKMFQRSLQAMLQLIEDGRATRWKHDRAGQRTRATGAWAKKARNNPAAAADVRRPHSWTSRR
jgi:prephenate dehydrogenase